MGPIAWNHLHNSTVAFAQCGKCHLFVLCSVLTIGSLYTKPDKCSTSNSDQLIMSRLSWGLSDSNFFVISWTAVPPHMHKTTFARLENLYLVSLACTRRWSEMRNLTWCFTWHILTWSSAFQGSHLWKFLFGKSKSSRMWPPKSSAAKLVMVNNFWLVKWWMTWMVGFISLKS